MPITMAKIGEPNIIKKVGGKSETRKFLENLGFVTGGQVTVVSQLSGNMIVNVKESRVAINRDMANKIIIYGRENHEDIKASSLREHSESHKAPWGGACQAADYGHGDYQRG